jgi:hypothetical protein
MNCRVVRSGDYDGHFAGSHLQSVGEATVHSTNILLHCCNEQVCHIPGIIPDIGTAHFECLEKLCSSAVVLTELNLEVLLQLS